MDNKSNTGLRQQSDKAALAVRALAFDPARYRDELAAMNRSEEAQAELLEQVRRIMSTFVDLAFGEDATQLAWIAGDNVGVAREIADASTLGSVEKKNLNDDRTLAMDFRERVTGD